MLAATQSVRSRKPRKILIASPVGSVSACRQLSKEADGSSFVSASPQPFAAVGAWYSDFSQVKDAEVHAILDQALRMTMAGSETWLTQRPSRTWVQIDSRPAGRRLAFEITSMPWRQSPSQAMARPETSLAHLDQLRHHRRRRAGRRTLIQSAGMRPPLLPAGARARHRPWIILHLLPFRPHSIGSDLPLQGAFGYARSSTAALC